MVLSGVCILLSVFSSCITITMLCSQWVYIMNGVTTNEEVRDKWKDDDNPYDNGCWANCSEFYCGEAGPSIDQRAKSVGLDRSFETDYV